MVCWCSSSSILHSSLLPAAAVTFDLLPPVVSAQICRGDSNYFQIKCRNICGIVMVCCPDVKLSRSVGLGVRSQRCKWINRDRQEEAKKKKKDFTHFLQNFKLSVSFSHDERSDLHLDNHKRLRPSEQNHCQMQAEMEYRRRRSLFACEWEQMEAGVNFLSVHPHTHSSVSIQRKS